MRARIAGALVALLIVASAVLGTTTAAVAAPAAGAAPSAFGSCVAGGGDADVLLLIDESSSLTGSDPRAARVTAAQYLAGQLGRFAERTGRPVDVQVAGFGDRYARVGGWTDVQDGAGALDRTIASFRGRSAGFDTDYWTALHRAQLDLAARARQAGGRRCQAVVWFTDGKLDYFPRTTGEERSRYGTRKVFAPDVELVTPAAASRVRAAAQQDLCRAGGIADQLRSSGIAVFAVGLDRGANAAGQFRTMQAIATGRAAGGDCGRVAADGSFTRVSDIADLLFAFDAIGTPDSAPITQEAGICSGSAVCADGAHRFVLDASTPEVQVLATAPRSGLEVRVERPDGALIRIPSSGSGTRTSGGVRAAYSWVAGDVVRIDLDRAKAADAAWQGVWQLAFTAPRGVDATGRSRTSIHILSPITPTVAGLDAEVRRGADLRARFGLAVRGTAIDPADLLGDVDFRAVLIDSAGRSHPIVRTADAAAIATPRTVDLAAVPLGAGSLDLEVRITTAAATTTDGERVPGTALAPKRVSVPLTVLPPARYPAVTGGVDFGQVTGTAPADAVLATRGAGCVWIADGAVRVQAGPADVHGFRIASGSAASRDSCVHVGASGRVPLRLVADGAGNGVLNGSVQVLTAPEAGGDPVTASVAVTARYAKPLNTANFLLTLIAALLLGPGVPLLLFFLMKALVSRIPPRSLVAAVVPVRVTESGVQRDGSRFTVRAEDFRLPVPIGRHGERRVDAAGLELAVRLGLSPFGLGRVVVRTPGRLALSDADGLRVGDAATLPLAVHDHFVLLRAPGAPEDAAEVLLLLAGDAGPGEQQDLGDRVDRLGPAMRDALLAAERSGGTADPGGSDAGAGGTSPYAVAPSGGGAAPSGSDDQWSF